MRDYWAVVQLKNSFNLKTCFLFAKKKAAFAEARRAVQVKYIVIKFRARLNLFFSEAKF